jgi:chorismate mutase
VYCRGIRGATTVKDNSRESVIAAGKELLRKIVEANEVDVDDIAAVWFTTSIDVNAEFPAVAARELGWLKTAMLCGHEMNVPGSLSGCIRVLMLVNTYKKSDELLHIYLRGAQKLRPDLS